MAGVIHLLGRTGKFLATGTNLQGAPLLAPGGAEVLQDLTWWLVPSPWEGVEKCRQRLGAGNDSARGLVQGNRAFFEIAGKIRDLVGEVEAESQNGERETTGACDGFDQQSGQLLIFPKEVVGPLETGLHMSEDADRIRGRQGTNEGEAWELRFAGLQQNRAPEAEGTIRDPGVALASPASGLNFRRPGGRNFRGFAGKVLGGAGLGDHMDVTPKWAFRRQENFDEGGIERIECSRPRG